MLAIWTRDLGVEGVDFQGSDPEASTLTSEPSTLNPELSTLNSEPSTLNPQL